LTDDLQDALNVFNTLRVAFPYTEFVAPPGQSIPPPGQTVLSALKSAETALLYIMEQPKSRKGMGSITGCIYRQPLRIMLDILSSLQRDVENFPSLTDRLPSVAPASGDGGDEGGDGGGAGAGDKGAVAGDGGGAGAGDKGAVAGGEGGAVAGGEGGAGAGDKGGAGAGDKGGAGAGDKGGAGAGDKGGADAGDKGDAGAGDEGGAGAGERGKKHIREALEDDIVNIEGIGKPLAKHVYAAIRNFFDVGGEDPAEDDFVKYLKHTIKSLGPSKLAKLQDTFIFPGEALDTGSVEEESASNNEEADEEEANEPEEDAASSSVAKKRPRGRAPLDADKKPKIWNEDIGVWEADK
jgi:hypothetical protein